MLRLSPHDMLVGWIALLIAFAIGWHLRNILAKDEEDYARWRLDRLALANARLIMMLRAQNEKDIIDGEVIRS